MDIKACAAALVLTGLVTVSGCETKQPFVTPLAPQVVIAPAPPTPPIVLVPVRVEGRVVDSDFGAPVPGALVIPDEFCAPGVCTSVPNQPDASAIADGQGRFGLTVLLPPDWKELLLRAMRNGHEPTRRYFRPDGILDVVLTVHPTITIRAGESIETRVFLQAQSCGSEGWNCRRIVVEAQSGQQMNLEVIPLEGQTEVGLIVGPELNHPFSPTPERRVTMSGGEVWIYGGVGRLTLTAAPLPKEGS